MQVMEIAKEWENHGGMQLVHVPQDAKRDAQIRIKFSSRNQCAIGPLFFHLNTYQSPNHDRNVYSNLRVFKFPKCDWICVNSINLIICIPTN